MQIRYDRGNETIKTWDFKLMLSNKDMKKFYELAYTNGVTPEEILQGFICDLICGTQTRGSDERDLAEQYFDRCCYHFEAGFTFLSWLLNEGNLEVMDNYLHDKEIIEEDIKWYQDNPEDLEENPNDLDNLKQDLATTEKGIADLYNKYVEEKKRRNESPQDLQEGLDEVKAYLQELERIKDA